MTTKSKLAGTGKPALRKAIELLSQAEEEIKTLQDHFRCNEFEENESSNLGVALRCTAADITTIRREIDDLLFRFHGRALKLTFPKRK